MDLRAAWSVVGVAALLSHSAVLATTGDDVHTRERPPGPPREALEACNGKKAGDSVTFKDREGRSIKAECRLIAVPERSSMPR